jgi:thiol-disulfide isomerase/thioredoxin
VVALTLYSRPGCHLCDEMKAVVQRVAASGGAEITVDEIDISTDPALEALYGLEIPVLLVNGRKVAKYRIRDAELERIVAVRASESGGLG